ncbi:MAG: type I DNA topoisomerase, partial [Pseudomonadota bacterium]|nr:type I DNA topoisomerase [Pseudomonadota bacterium]
MHLVVVESPAKAKTIESYLGSEYKVIASLGHIRDLPSSEGSVKPDQDFEMVWELGEKGKKQAKTINEAVKNSESLILATDPDREGEAIAWHVLDFLQKKGSLKDKKISRVTFNAITKSEINEAINNPREIDNEMVEAYLARRALDYLVGFTLSPVLWRKLPGARSAGRVQSVALRLICEREIEIESFKPQEYWSIEGMFSYEDFEPFEAKLTHFNNDKLDQFDINNEKQSQEIKKIIDSNSYKVNEVKEKEVTRKPSPPFITSTLQMESSRKLGMTAKNTMMTAQKLYEAGLITYMRTDGVQIGKESIEELRSSISAIYGDKYLPKELNEYKGKVANAQEAHEAIRPTDPKKTPDILKNDLSSD